MQFVNHKNEVFEIKDEHLESLYIMSKDGLKYFSFQDLNREEQDLLYNKYLKYIGVYGACEADEIYDTCFMLYFITAFDSQYLVAVEGSLHNDEMQEDIHNGTYAVKNNPWFLKII